MGTKVGAVLACGARVINFACNLYRNHSSIDMPRSYWSKHAEFRVTLNTDATGATVYVYREHGLTGMPAMAKHESIIL